MDWLDTHDGSLLAIATLILVVVTGCYYAWVTRGLVRETRTALLASSRATLQSRMDRVSEILIQQPELFDLLDDPNATGQENDARFHLANMFLAILEEAHTQYAIDRSMPADDWSAWAAMADTILERRYMVGYWRRARRAYEPAFQRFVDGRLASPTPAVQ